MTKVSNSKILDMLHIIPFDTGFDFNDESVYKKSTLTQWFVDNFKSQLNSNEDLTKTWKLIEKNDSEYINYKDYFPRETVLVVKISEFFYINILKNGVGIFVFLEKDINLISLLPNLNLNNVSDVIKLGYAKRNSQKFLLNDYENNIFENERKIIKNILQFVWNIKDIVPKKFKYALIRKDSCQSAFKNNGLSYVLSIYINNSLSDKEIDFLMHSPFISKVRERNNWEDVQEHLNSYEGEKEKIVTSYTKNKSVIFSWSGVFATLKNTKDYKNDTLLDALKSEDIISDILKIEIESQAKWFIADATIDNFKNGIKKAYLQDIIRNEYQLEKIISEVENPTSANMTTLYKDMLQKVVKTSELLSIASSNLKQIQVYKKLKLSQYEEVKVKTTFWMSLFMAIFTAATIYKSISEMRKNGTSQFDYKNIIIFISILVVLVIGLLIKHLLRKK